MSYLDYPSANVGIRGASVGVTIWLVTVIGVIGLMVEQFRRYKAKQPYTHQPIQGARYAAAASTYSPSFVFPFLIQLLLIVGMLISLLSYWTFILADPTPGNQLLLFNSLMTCPYQSVTMYAEVDLSDQHGTCFFIMASHWTTAFFAVASVFLMLFQAVIMVTNWNTFTANVAAGPGIVPNYSMLPGIWVRTNITLSLFYAMLFLYGLLTCVLGGFVPSSGYILVVFLAFLARLQYYLIEEFIEALPPPLPGGVAGFVQCAAGGRGGDVSAAAVAPATRAAVEMNVVQAHPMQQQQQYYHQQPYGALYPGAHVPMQPGAYPASHQLAPAYGPPVAQAVAVAPRVQAEGNVEPLAAPGFTANRSCPSCNAAATGAGRFCSSCGAQL